MNYKKHLIIPITLAIIVGSFSCGTKTDGSDDTSSAKETAETSVQEDTGVKSELPKLDFGGKDFTIFVEDYGGVCGPEFCTEEADGDIVNDAVYMRNVTVSEQLNLNIKWELFTHGWNDRSEFTNKFRSSVFAGDGSYDLAAGTGYFMPAFVSDRILYDMSSLPYIDISKPWWSKEFMEVSAVDGKYYFVTGDACLGLIKNMYCVFENLDLAETLGVENLYDVVREGRWTLDKMKETAAAQYSDLNGNTKIDRDDRFGLLMDGGNHITGFFEALEVDIVEFRNGQPEFIYDNAHNTDVVEKLTSFVMNTEGIYFDEQANDETADNSIFRDGNVLMSTGWLNHTESFRDLSFSYGVLPYPKWDESQTEYKTSVFPCYSVLTVPVDSHDKECAAAVCEALAYESWKSVTPAYFETALKVKYANDSDSAQMFDIIRDGISFDFGYVYTLPLNAINDKFKDCVRQEDSWASFIAKIKPAAVEKLNELVDQIRDMNN